MKRDKLHDLRIVSKLIIVVLLITPSIHSGMSIDNPIIYWSMDSLIGTKMGDPILQQNGCVIGSCVSFDGKSGLFISKDPLSLSSIQEQTTFTVWIKTSNNITDLQYIITQSMYDNSDLLVNIGRGIFIRDGSIWLFTQSKVVGEIDISMGSITTNTWYFVALVQDGSSLTGFLNDFEPGPYIFSGAVNLYYDYWSLGLSPNYQYGFNGTLDEIKIYQTPLSKSNINAIFNSVNYYSLVNPNKADSLTLFIENYSIFVIFLIILIIFVAYNLKITKRRKGIPNKINFKQSPTESDLVQKGYLLSTGMYCVNCKLELHPDDKFCQYCGNPIIKSSKNF